MYSKTLMTASAAMLAIIGICFIFIPGELIAFLKLPDEIYLQVIFQLTGALYLGFAILNYMARGNIIGGVYSRPLALANFTNFFVGGMALIKSAFRSPDLLALWILSLFYLVFAILFGLVLFRHPKQNK
ncbi:MAG TPA: hypothetical protein VKA26_10175 [Ignavibacteriaceae bacterium]|nr:hypothetical protein [Ignavibacteriaceae bacterium]